MTFIRHSLEVLVSDVAKLDEVRPQAVHLPVCLSVVLHLRSQVFLQMDFAVIDLPETTLQLLVVDQKTNPMRRSHRSEQCSGETPIHGSTFFGPHCDKQYLSRSLSAPSD